MKQDPETVVGQVIRPLDLYPEPRLCHGGLAEGHPKRDRLVILRPALGQGGADRVTLDLLKLLDRNRFEITLVLCQFEGEFTEDIPNDIRVTALGAGSLWRSVRPLARCLTELEPDVVFSTSSGTNIVAILAKRLTRQKYRVILSERNVLFHGGRTLKRRALVLLKRALYRKADSITAVSQGVKRDLVEILGVPAESIAVVYNPIITNEIAALQQEPIAHPWFKAEIPLILGAGRLVPEKDFETLVQAFAIVRKTQLARLVILGEGPLKTRLKDLIRSLGLEADVWLAGFDKNPFRYMAACTVFVLSSRNEGLPGVLIQAMACGAPVVSTDCHAGPAEIISMGIDGWLVPVGDAEAMAERITHYLTNPQVRRQCALQATTTAQRFRADLVLPAYVNAVSDSTFN